MIEGVFLKGISLKVNVIARLGFEFAYFEAAVQNFSLHVTVNILHYTYTQMDMILPTCICFDAHNLVHLAAEDLLMSHYCKMLMTPAK